MEPFLGVMPMRMIVDLELEVKMEGDRTNANEVFLAAEEALREAEGQVVQKVVEAYQEQVVSTLCRASGRKAKKGLGGHEVKGDPNRRCRHRRFRRAGYWSDRKFLYGPRNVVEFRPAMIECQGCGKRLTPILDALELEPYQRRTDGLLRVVTESVAETSYRRGAGQLEVFGEVPVPKSTAHRWVADVELPVQEIRGEPILGGDGTGFKRQPGERGEVRFVLEIGENGRLHPLGVWAGASWKEISEELKDRQAGQAKMFISDGERALENWLGRLAEDQSRCHWHLSRDAGYAMWQDQAPLSERKETQKELRRLLAIGIPEKDLEQVSPEEKEELCRRIAAAEAKLDELHRDFEKKGYEKAATYLANARDRLFGYLQLWLETGIACPRATSIIENLIRELVRRLKKIGWNWSDAGAARMGRIVMVRRYDQEAWEEYWKHRLNLQDRCQITLTKCELQTAA
jgi:hypothetical protein